MAPDARTALHPLDDLATAGLIHDLRAPLQGARAQLAVLLERADLPAPAASHALAAQGALAHLGRLVDQLAATLRDRNGIDDVVEQVAPATLVADSMAAVTAERRLRAVEVVVAVEADALVPCAMPLAAVRRLLDNALANAIAHAERGNVLVTARRRGQHLTLEVGNRCLVPQLSRPGRPDSIGIGIAACRQLAGRIGGTFAMRADAGAGTVFATIRVPVIPTRGRIPRPLRGWRIEVRDPRVAHAHALAGLLRSCGAEVTWDAAAGPPGEASLAIRPPTAAPWHLPLPDGTALATLPGRIVAGAPPVQPAAATPMRAAGPWVLVVDDSPLTGAAMVALLASAGHPARWVGTLREASAAVASARPVAVIVDEHLPDGRGSRWRDDPARAALAAAVPLVVVSAEPDPQRRVVDRPTDRAALLRLLDGVDTVGQADPARPARATGTGAPTRDAPAPTNAQPPALPGPHPGVDLATLAALRAEAAALARQVRQRAPSSAAALHRLRGACAVLRCGPDRAEFDALGATLSTAAARGPLRRLLRGFRRRPGSGAATASG